MVNGDGEAEQFYSLLEAPALVGTEACGNSQWFMELLERLGHQVWIGDAARIRASYFVLDNAFFLMEGHPDSR